MKKKLSIRDRIVKYVFKTSTQPIRFKDLLSANSHFNEKMHVDPGKLGFRMNITRAYLIYGIIVTSIIVPIFLVTHKLFEEIDFHVSIIGSIAATAFICIYFRYFEDWIRDAITFKQIKKAWPVHFPYFSYEKYSKIVENIYNEAHKKEIKSNELQQFVMDKLISIQE